MREKNRRFPIGAERVPEGTHFRVWAPKQGAVSLFLPEEESEHPMEAEECGYFSLLLPHKQEGTLYQFRFAGNSFPDPASRFQPHGPFGPSQVVDPSLFSWTDQQWKGLDPKRQIIYEIHVGTFTPEGSWQGALKKLPALAALGITTIEMMPIAEFPGKWNWGYDGVNLFAPTHTYGTPDDLRAFIEGAHQLGLGVILDLVYNHLGPSGNHLKNFSEEYFCKKSTDWGAAVNFQSKSVREFLTSNIRYWVEEFHFDGFRFDACQAIKDDSTPHIIAELAAKARQQAGCKTLYIVAENEQQESHYVLSPQEGGYGLDGVYNEDFHHAARVRMTHHNEAYYTDYLGKAQEFVSSAKYGFLYQGQWYSHQKQKRGTPSLQIEPWKLINFLENHDQVANAIRSLRLYSFVNPETLRALTALLFLFPQTPMIFQGQEFGDKSPFYFFCDHGVELSNKIYKGRLHFLKQFKSVRAPNITGTIVRPDAEETFLASKINWNEREEGLYQLYKDLIALRKEDPVFSDLAVRIEGSVLNDDAFILRYFSSEGERLLLVNLGGDLMLEPAPDPLLAPPSREVRWEVLWSSEDSKYEGMGFIPFPKAGNWRITGNASFILGLTYYD